MTEITPPPGKYELGSKERFTPLAVPPHPPAEQREPKSGRMLKANEGQPRPDFRPKPHLTQKMDLKKLAEFKKSLEA